MNLLELKRITYDFGRGPILHDVSFQVAEGEIFGIIGPNGGGKSTLLSIMSGLLPAKKGEALFRDKPVTQYKKRELARQIAVLEQDGTPPLPFTVEEVVAMGRYPWLKPFAGLTEADQQVVDKILAQLSLTDIRKQPVNTLSGGQRQLVSLARAMAQEPQVLILDEPTTFLDIGHQIQVMQHVRQWHENKHLTVIMVLHDLNLAAQYCQRLLLLDQGTVKAIGSVDDILKEQTISNVYHTELVMVKHPILDIPQLLLHGA